LTSCQRSIDPAAQRDVVQALDGLAEGHDQVHRFAPL
jgi:hypothetical protein